MPQRQLRATHESDRSVNGTEGMGHDMGRCMERASSRVQFEFEFGFGYEGVSIRHANENEKNAETKEQTEIHDVVLVLCRRKTTEVEVKCEVRERWRRRRDEREMSRRCSGKRCERTRDTDRRDTDEQRDITSGRPQQTRANECDETNRITRTRVRAAEQTKTKRPAVVQPKRNRTHSSAKGTKQSLAADGFG